MIVGGSFEGLGLVVAELDSYNSVCKTVAFVIGNNTRSSAVTSRNIRASLKSQVLSGITCNIDGNSIRSLACCSCVQVILAEQISIQNNLILAIVIGVYLAVRCASVMYDAVGNYAAVYIINNAGDRNRSFEFERQRHIAGYRYICFCSLTVLLSDYLVIIRERRNGEGAVRTSLTRPVRSAILKRYSYVCTAYRGIVAITNNRTGNREAIDYKVYAIYVGTSYRYRYACSCRVDMICIKLKVCGCRVLAIHYTHRPVAVLISLNAVCLIRIGIQFENNSSVNNGVAVLISYLTRNGLCIDIPRPNIARSNTRRIRLAIAVCILSGLVQQLRAGYRILNLDLVVISRDVLVRERAISDNGLLAYLLVLAVKQRYNCAQHRLASIVNDIAADGYIVGYLYCVVRGINVVSSLRITLRQLQTISASVQTGNGVLRTSFYICCYLNDVCSGIVQDAGVKACRLRTGNRVLAICLSYLRLILLITNGYIVGCVDFAISVHCDAVVTRLSYFDGVIALCIGQGCGHQVEVIASLLVQSDGSRSLCRTIDGVVTRDSVVSKGGVVVVRIACGQILSLLVYSRDLDMVGYARCNGEVVSAILIGVSYIDNVAVRVDDFYQSRSLLAILIEDHAVNRRGVLAEYSVKILSCCGVSTRFEVTVRNREVQNARSVCAVGEYANVVAGCQTIYGPVTFRISRAVAHQRIVVCSVNVNVYAFDRLSRVYAIIGEVNAAVYYTRFRRRLRIRSRVHRISRIYRIDLLIDLLNDVRPLSICAAYCKVQFVSKCIGVVVSVSAAVIVKYNINHVGAIAQLIKAVRAISLGGGHADILCICQVVFHLIQQYNAAFRHRSLGCCIGLIGLIVCLAGCLVTIKIAVGGRVAVYNNVRIILIAQMEVNTYTARVSVITILIGSTNGKHTLRDILDFVVTICISGGVAYCGVSLISCIVQISRYRYICQLKFVAGVVQIIYGAAHIIVGVADGSVWLIRLREVVGLGIAIIQQCGQRVGEYGNRVNIGFALILVNVYIVPSISSVVCKRAIFQSVIRARNLYEFAVRLTVNEELHVNVGTFNLIPALHEIAILAVVLIMCFGLVIPDYLTGYIDRSRIVRQGNIQTGSISGCVIVVRSLNEFNRVLNRLAVLVNVLQFPAGRPGAIGRAAGQSLGLTGCYSVCEQLNFYGLRTFAIAVCVIVPHYFSINRLGFLIAGDRCLPFILSSQVIQTAVALTPLSCGQIVPGIRLNRRAILGCSRLITFVKHCRCGVIRPAERVAYRDSSTSLAPYREVLDRASPSIARTGQGYRTNLRAIAVNINGNSRRTNCIIIIAVVPVCREIEANRLSHGDSAVIAVVYCVRGILIHICNLCRPNNCIAIQISRQVCEGISPRVCIVLNSIGLGKMYGLVLYAICQQLDIYAVGVRAVVPSVVVIHPVKGNCKILLCLTNIVLIVTMRQADVKTIILAVYLCVPACDTSSTSRCVVEDLVCNAIIDCILLQTIDRVSPAGRTIAAPFGNSYGADICTLCVSYLAGYTIQLIGTDNTGLSVRVNIDCQTRRTIAALVIGVEPVNMARFAASFSRTLQRYDDLIRLSIRCRQLNVLRGRNLIIRCAVFIRKRYRCIVLDLSAIGRVYRQLAKRALYVVNIKIYGLVVLCAINRNTICGQRQIQNFGTNAVRIAIIVEAERHIHVCLYRLIGQIQIHTCGHCGIGLACIVVQFDRVID